MNSFNTDQNSPYDVIVIGAGVVGCALVRRLTLLGAKVLLAEKGADILSGASKGNSAILHTGFDAPTGSLELACMQAGYAEYLSLYGKMNLPLLRTGAMVVAWSEQDEHQLEGILAQAHANGVTDSQRLNQTQIIAREPYLSRAARAAIEVPGEYLIDPWSAPLGYLLHAQLAGAKVLLNTEITGGEFTDDAWQLHSNQGTLKAHSVINCAGLFGDQLEARLLGQASFRIQPRKGQFVVFDKAAANLLTRIVLPVPNERTKGIVLTRTVFGNLLVGPTAEEQEDRVHAQLATQTLQELIDAAKLRIPALAHMPVTATYAGLRPASEQKHYRISAEPEKNYICVGGIRSTGLTAALGIAQHVATLYQGQHRPIDETRLAWPQLPNLAEHLPRDYQRPDYGEIVCHCEMVTRREITNALNSSLPPGDLGGLKRRTRACMGRCQGFYCSAKVAQLSQGRLAVDLATGSCADEC